MSKSLPGGPAPRPLARRTVLRGLGTAVALPWFSAMGPLASLGGTARAAEATEVPVRGAFVFVPNGVHLPTWTPKSEGADYELPPTLEPLARHRDDLLVLSGLTLDGGRAHGDGPGDHARAAASFLTTAHPVKTGGSDIRAGVSVDQLAARRFQGVTRFPSLELGCERTLLSGECDSGYSCAYSSNVSWRTPTSPMPKEIDPRRVFERLFQFGRPGDSAEARERRLRTRRSVLDYVRGDTKRLERDLGTTDRRKLDEYLVGVRELERRLEAVADDGGGAPAGAEAPDGIPRDHGAHIRLMADLIVLAFRTDTTRVVTLMFGNAGSNRTFPQLGVPEGHHGLSHHGGDPKKNEKLRLIDRYHVEQLAYLLDGLRSTTEGPDERPLLESAAVLYGSGLADGNKHDHADLPVLLAGRAGGAIRPGRHLRRPTETPMANLYVTLLGALGTPTERFGDSTGALDVT